MPTWLRVMRCDGVMTCVSVFGCDTVTTALADSAVDTLNSDGVNENDAVGESTLIVSSDDAEGLAELVVVAEPVAE